MYKHRLDNTHAAASFEEMWTALVRARTQLREGISPLPS